MTVKELITKLETCNPDDTVMYVSKNVMPNASYVTIDGVLQRIDVSCTIDKVRIGIGQEKGIVFLDDRIFKNS